MYLITTAVTNESSMNGESIIEQDGCKMDQAQVHLLCLQSIRI